MMYRFAVLGDPVDHSRSPELHTAMLELEGLDGTYQRVQADVAVLEQAINGLRHGEWHGLNITMPLKADAARLADSLSPGASRSGSVNTLALKGDKVLGESTDISAFEELFSSDRFKDFGSILVLGAGGSAAAAISAIPLGFQVYLASRRRAKAEELADRIGAEVIPWGTGVAGALIVNSTPLGMNGENLPGSVVDTAAGLIDLPYGAVATPAVAAATERGIPHSDGHEFLLRQAIASFTLWTTARIKLQTLQDKLTKR